MFLTKKLPQNHWEMPDDVFYEFIEENVVEWYAHLKPHYIFAELIAGAANMLLQIHLDKEAMENE